MNVNRYITSLPHNLPEDERPMVGMCVCEDDDSTIVTGYIARVYEENIEIILFDPVPLKYLEELTDVLFYELIPEKQVYEELGSIIDENRELLDLWVNMETY